MREDARTVAEYIEQRQIEGSSINQALKEQEKRRMSDQTITQYDAHLGEMSGDSVDRNFEDAQTISGEDIAPTPAPEDYIKAVVSVFSQIDEQEYDIAKLTSFEQVMVGVMVRMFKLMQEKQRGYGKSNISKAGLHGLFTRATDKIERAKNIVGDPVEQVERVQELIRAHRLDPTADTDANFIDNVAKIVNTQEFAEESIEDTLIDLANYGLIMYMVQNDAWGKDMEENQ
jgi:hypothetical protein